MIKRLAAASCSSPPLLPARRFAGTAEGVHRLSVRQFFLALQELQPAADAGDAMAQAVLGFMYINGQGVAQDDALALKWFGLSAAGGNSDAQHNLAYMYDTGLGAPRNVLEAMKWYKLAAAQGRADSQFNLANIYQTRRAGRAQGRT